MADKNIDSLPELNIQDADPSVDVLIAQKADGITFKLPLSDFNNQVTKNITTESPAKIIDNPKHVQHTAIKETYDLDVPDDAKIAIMALRWVGSYPAIRFKYFNNTNFSGNGFCYKYGRYRAGRMGGDPFFVPIINKKVYFLYEYRNITYAADSELRLLGYI
tara:strand:+ start:4580 stop:5065 length:486 start_codon:yes stop_codon:yes gene_type:complete